MTREQNRYYEQVVRCRVPKYMRPDHHQIFSELHDHFKSPNYKYMGIEDCEFNCYSHNLKHSLTQCFASTFVYHRRVQDKLDKDGTKA